MKPYLLFYGSRYYACGGWEDFRGEFDTIEAAKEAFFSSEEDVMDGTEQWAQIVCAKTKAIVKKIDRKYSIRTEAYAVTESEVSRL